MLAAMPLVFVGPGVALDGILRTDERFSAWNPHNLRTVHHGFCHGTDRTDRTVPGD